MKNCLLISLLLLSCLSAQAQKLPSTQKVSLLAPANIKIDGKTTEWQNQFQAYNTAIDVFYTMANDDENLYLTIQVTKDGIISKALTGGVVFTINHDTKKDDKNPMIFTFPIFNAKDKSAMGDIISKRVKKADTAVMRKQTDSLVLAGNKLLSQKVKTIQVLGIKEVPDTIISVYNEQNIQFAAKFDSKRAITFELAVLLNYWAFRQTRPKPFAYNIKLQPGQFGGAIIMRSPSGVITGITVMVDGASGQSNRYATDMWAEYTPAKK